MATRDEVMGATERLIRRGELGEASALLEMWTRANPSDAAAATRLATIRALADPTPSRPRVVARAEAPPLGAPPRQERPIDPVDQLKKLLERIQANRR